MSPRHFAVFLTCLSVLGACTPTDEATTSTEASDPSTTCEVTTSESGGTDLEDNHTAYLSGYVVVPLDQVDATLSLLSDSGIDVGEAGIDDVLGEEGLEDEEAVAARSSLNEIVQIFTVSENGADADPLAVAEDIRAQDPQLRIAPIHAIGEAGHIAFKAGTDPEPVEGDIEPPADAAEDASLAAVVDSGIYGETPGLSGNVEMTQLDEEPSSGEHSHGTFVSSIVRQLSSEHRITFARARMVPLADFAWSDGDPGATDLTSLTTELHVAEAILRILHRHENESERVQSLNLSLGAYSPLLQGDTAMTTIFLVLDRWFATFPDAPVFAAGGNDPVVDPFWPGALEPVVAVGALNDPPGAAPVEIVWHDSDDDGRSEEVPWTDVTSTSRDWIDDLAPGSLLVNYSQPEVLACWSGSSFASAVANGLYLRGESPIPPSRGDIAGLTYWDGTKIAP